MHSPLSIERSVLAILARFGNQTAAMDYCFNTAASYPALRYIGIIVRMKIINGGIK
jgi:hypothetical protein